MAHGLVHFAGVNGLLASETIAKYWILSCIAVYLSPGDAIFQMLRERKNPFRYFCFMMDGVDSITTLTARIDQIQSMYPGNPVAPYMVALALAKGGLSITNYVTWVVRAPYVLYGVKYIDLVSLGKKGERC